MKIVRDLKFLEQSANRSVRRAICNVPQASALISSFDREELMTYATINLLNSWTNFVRAYFVCCLLGVRSPTGNSTKQITSRLTGSISTPQQAIGHAVLHFRPAAAPRFNGEWDSRDEPTWHDSGTILQLANAFNLSNQADIQTAFSFGFTAHRNLVVFRNYYAHKNRVTREKAQSISIQYSIPQSLHPSAALLATPLTTPTTSLIGMWADELTQTASLLCS